MMMFVCYLCVVSIILGVVSAGVARWVPVKQMQMGQMAHKASGDLFVSCQWETEAEGPLASAKIRQDRGNPIVLPRVW